MALFQARSRALSIGFLKANGTGMSVGLWSRQQTLGFLEQESRIGEWLISDILPTDAPLSIDQNGSMERLAFEVIKAAEVFEHIQIRVRQQWDIHGAIETLEPIAERLRILGADAYDLNSGVLELLHLGRECF